MSKFPILNVNTLVTKTSGRRIEMAAFHANAAQIDTLTIGEGQTTGGDGSYDVTCIVSSPMWNINPRVDIKLTKSGKIVFGNIPLLNMSVDNTVTVSPGGNPITITYTPDPEIATYLIPYTAPLGTDVICFGKFLNDPSYELWGLNLQTNPIFVVILLPTEVNAGDAVMIRPMNFSYSTSV